MVDPTVRPADVERDLAVLEMLEAEARTAVVGQRGGERWLAEHPPIDTGWSARLGRDDVLVAHIDDVVVGYVVPVLGADDILRIDQIWVTPAARELGFGDELLATAIERGRHAGAVAVEGQALPGDRQTKNLYERAGIVARLITTFKSF